MTKGSVYTLPIIIYTFKLEFSIPFHNFPLNLWFTKKDKMFFMMKLWNHVLNLLYRLFDLEFRLYSCIYIYLHLSQYFNIFSFSSSSCDASNQKTRCAIYLILGIIFLGAGIGVTVNN